MNSQNRMKYKVIRIYCGKLCGEVGVKASGKPREKKIHLWGKVYNLGLSTNYNCYPQSYPHCFPRRYQSIIQKSTDTTMTTTLYNRC